MEILEVSMVFHGVPNGFSRDFGNSQGALPSGWCFKVGESAGLVNPWPGRVPWRRNRGIAGRSEEMSSEFM